MEFGIGIYPNVMIILCVCFCASWEPFIKTNNRIWTTWLNRKYWWFSSFNVCEKFRFDGKIQELRPSAAIVRCFSHLILLFFLLFYFSSTCSVSSFESLILLCVAFWNLMECPTEKKSTNNNDNNNSQSICGMCKPKATKAMAEADTVSWTTMHDHTYIFIQTFRYRNGYGWRKKSDLVSEFRNHWDQHIIFIEMFVVWLDFYVFGLFSN